MLAGRKPAPGAGENSAAEAEAQAQAQAEDLAEALSAAPEAGAVGAILCARLLNARAPLLASGVPISPPSWALPPLP